MSEFNLSDKSYRITNDNKDKWGYGDKVLDFNDVKEFIKRLKQKLYGINKMESLGNIDWNELIDKLAGEKLK